MAVTGASEAGWLSLQEASSRLRAHPDTLRQWADRGHIRSFRTPGGHRRFSEADVEALAGRPNAELGLLLEASIGRARLVAAAGDLAQASWYSHFDEAAKQKQRELGHELMRVLISYASDPDHEDPAAIHQLGGRYAALARESGLSLGDAMRAFHHFEGVVRSSVDQLMLTHRSSSLELEQSTSRFLNEVRIAMVELFTEKSR